MRLSVTECRRRLLGADHGVLATRHRDRGVDAVPVCFSVVGPHLAVPIDRVKPKDSLSLQRQANLDSDARAVLMVEHWDPEDWSQLWWVRVHLSRRRDEGSSLGADPAALLAGLRARYPQYRDAAAIAGVMVFAITGLSGWAGADSLP